MKTTKRTATPKAAKKHPHASDVKPQRPRAELPTSEIVSYREAAAMVGLSYHVFFLMVHDEATPRPIELSKRRRGFRRATILRWIEFGERIGKLPNRAEFDSMTQAEAEALSPCK